VCDLLDVVVVVVESGWGSKCVDSDFDVRCVCVERERERERREGE
jgi:predicted nucleotidyltransferase